MTAKFDIDKLHFGNDDAERDEQQGFLDKVFLWTSIFNRAREGRSELIIGRKGSGKSAICFMLKRAFENAGSDVILVTPAQLSPSKLEQLKIHSINEDESYLLAWKYVLLVKLGEEIISRNNFRAMPDDVQPDIEYLRKFLVNNDEASPNTYEKLSNWFSNLKLSFSVAGYGAELGANTTMAPDAQKDIANKLDLIQSKLEHILQKLETPLVLLIDKVDDIWNHTSEAKSLIVNLIKCVHDLNSSLPNSHTVVFLRSDIYDTLKFHDADKFRSVEERSAWKRNDLKHLIANRGRISTQLDEIGPDELWDMFFEQNVMSESSFDYIYKRTLRRPRELIQFCNKALSEAQDNGRSIITSSDILDAEIQYSKWKLRDLSVEFLVQYPYLEELLSLFNGFEKRFTISQFEERYKYATKRLTMYPILSEISTTRMLQILYNIGFLGIIIDGQDIYFYDHSTLIVAQFSQLVIHPVFHIALGSSSHVHTSGGAYIEGNVKVGGDFVGRDQDINIAGDLVSGDKVHGDKVSEATHLSVKEI